MIFHDLAFGGVTVRAPQSWRDITDELDGDNPPFTLADSDVDVGALQFSIARYVNGPVPNPSVADLRGMVEELGDGHGMTDPHGHAAGEGPPRWAATNFRYGDSFVRAWYVSGDGNFAKVTYTCAWDDRGKQVAACDAIVTSIRFG